MIKNKKNYKEENNKQTNLDHKQNLQFIIYCLQMFFASPEESNFEHINEQEEKLYNEEKDMIKQLNKLEINQNENTNTEGKSKPNESTECTEKEKQTKSNEKLKRKKKVNSISKVLKRCLLRWIKRRKKRKKTINKNSNNINIFEIKKNDINPNEESNLNSQIDNEHKNVKDIPKISEEDKKLEDLKIVNKVENNINVNKQNDNSYDAMSISSLGKNDNIHNDIQNEDNINNPTINNNADNLSISSEQNQNEDNIINPTINNNEDNLSISSEQNQNNNQNNSSQHGMSEDNSLNDNNSPINQNQGVILYEANQVNNEGGVQAPSGDMTYHQTYENDFSNNQEFGLNNGTNAFEEFPYDNNQDFDSMIDYINHLNNENEGENQLNSDDFDNLKKLESNYDR